MNWIAYAWHDATGDRQERRLLKSGDTWQLNSASNVQTHLVEPSAE